MCFFFSSRRRHTRYIGDWSSDVCSSDLLHGHDLLELRRRERRDLRLEPGFGRPHRVPGNAHNAVLLAQQVERLERKSVVWGKSVGFGGGRMRRITWSSV